ncbi:methyltransferase domain-containing protein [Streptomyces sp. URMC 129]|uniref:methyltransferase domain-containing protein n=1 Tax=Streptomyces sp. URMC 129 TaxID=3423407 RepID=UPI003F1BE593
MVSPRETVPARGLRLEEDAYRLALGRFLARTDEKTVTHAYLDRVVDTLTHRRVLLDVGPADGTTTRHLAPSFEDTVCIEPSAPMRCVLERTCPDATVLPDPVLAAEPGVAADLALLSHVLYYVPPEQWTATVLRVMEWVAPGGLLLVLLQNPDNACMGMVRHFTGCRFDVRDLARELAAAPPGLVGDVRLDALPARYSSPCLDETLLVADFLLSVPADRTGGAPLPPRGSVEAYVRRHFRTPEGRYVIRHDQDVLRIERPRH